MPLIDTRKIISSLLACTCLLWSSGCYTVTQITPADEHQGKEITIATKDGQEFRFKEWKLLPNGDIEGNGIHMVGVPKRGKPYEGTVVAENMLMVTYDEFNTTWTVIGCAVGLALVIGVAILASGGPVPSSIMK